MTPKEKAEELVNKYLRTYPIYDNPTVVISYTNNEAKQCALIAVDEIIENNLEYLRDAGLHNDVALNIDLSFWKKVKQEIELL
jgi:hypothetical protein